MTEYIYFLMKIMIQIFLKVFVRMHNVIGVFQVATAITFLNSLLIRLVCLFDPLDDSSIITMFIIFRALYNILYHLFDQI
jgi:hypothetical protein